MQRLGHTRVFLKAVQLFSNYIVSYNDRLKEGKDLRYTMQEVHMYSVSTLQLQKSSDYMSLGAFDYRLQSFSAVLSNYVVVPYQIIS